MLILANLLASTEKNKIKTGRKKYKRYNKPRQTQTKSTTNSTKYKTSNTKILQQKEVSDYPVGKKKPTNNLSIQH